MPALSSQRYSCHGCGECCRDFTIELRAEDFERLQSQGWQQILGAPFWIDFGGKRWLRQREDGACIFLGDAGRCTVHEKFGLQAKPLACQLFPFSFAPGPRHASVGISFACTSVRRSAGAELSSHQAEVIRMQSALPEAMQRAHAPNLVRGVAATESEVLGVASVLDAWLANSEIEPATRLEGFVWMAQSLRIAHLAKVRGERLQELLQTLAQAAPQELLLLDAKPVSNAAWRMVRQAVFARVEDPKIARMLRTGRCATVFSQWRRSRAWSRGVGEAPGIAGWKPILFRDMNVVLPLFQGSESAAIDELFSRWLRATLLASRAWGAGLYGLPIQEGIALVALNAVVAAWLATAHAASHGRTSITLEDASAAIGRVDRSSGRAPWLGGRAERLRVIWLAHSGTLQRAAKALVYPR